LGRVALGVALLVAAVGTVATQGSSTGIKVAFGLAAVVCGLGLLVGTFYGRARWLVVPAALFAGVSVAGAATENLGVHLSWSEQNTVRGPHVDGHPAPPVRIDTGRGDTYLQLEAIQEPVDGVIRVGAGSVRIRAADDVRLEVRAQVGLGSIELPSGSAGGYRRVATYAAGPTDSPLVRYDVAVGLGTIEVERYDPNRPIVGDPELSGPPIPGAVLPNGRGGYIYENGAQLLADGTIVLPDGSQIHPSGARQLNSPIQVLPNGDVLLIDGTRVEPDGTVILPFGVVVEPVPPGTSTAATVPSTSVPATAVPSTTVPSTAVSGSAAPTTVAPTTVVAQP
jgi:hypothetical protein